MHDQEAQAPFNSKLIIYSISISPLANIFLNNLSRKNWRGAGLLLFEVGAIDGF